MGLQVYDLDGFRVYAESENLYREGNFFVSVTAILDSFTPKQLKNWYINNSKNKVEKRLETTANLGTKIHDLIEKDLRGENPAIDQDCEPAWEVWQHVKNTHTIKPIDSELQVTHPMLGYAGKLDHLMIFDGEPAIIDIKSGFYSNKASAQMAAYMDAFNRSSTQLKIKRIVGVNIHREGFKKTTKDKCVFKIERSDKCFEAFLHALGYFRFMNFYILKKNNWKFLEADIFEYYNNNQK